MAYPNYYGYQPQQFYQPQSFQAPDMSRFQQTAQPNNNGILWVQGEEAARAYMVAPGNSVLLMDSDAERFFIKSVDVSGIPQPLRVFEYKERTNGQKAASAASLAGPGEVVTRKEFDELRAIVAQLTHVKEDNENG